MCVSSHVHWVGSSAGMMHEMREDIENRDGGERPFPMLGRLLQYLSDGMHDFTVLIGYYDYLGIRTKNSHRPIIVTGI